MYWGAVIGGAVDVDWICCWADSDPRAPPIAANLRPEPDLAICVEGVVPTYSCHHLEYRVIGLNYLPVVAVVVGVDA